MTIDTLRRPRLVAGDAIRYLLEHHGIPVAKSTLKTWAWRGGGPGYQKAGPRRLYPVEQLDEWAKRRLSPIVASTSELTNLPMVGRGPEQEAARPRVSVSGRTKAKAKPEPAGAGRHEHGHTRPTPPPRPRSNARPNALENSRR